MSVIIQMWKRLAPSRTKKLSTSWVMILRLTGRGKVAHCGLVNSTLSYSYRFKILVFICQSLFLYLIIFFMFIKSIIVLIIFLLIEFVFMLIKYVFVFIVFYVYV